MVPPRLDDLTPDTLVNVIIEMTQFTGLFNAAGLPAIAQPVRAPGTPLPASLQLVGPPRGEHLLLATARRLEAARQVGDASPGASQAHGRTQTPRTAPPGLRMRAARQPRITVHAKR